MYRFAVGSEGMTGNRMPAWQRDGWIQILEKMNDPGFVKKFVRVIIDDHDTTGENHSYGNTNDQTRSVVANGSFEEILVAGSHTFIDRYLPLSMTLRR